jgi:hypothetical protein
VLSVIIGMVLVFLSGLSGMGNYSGTLYQENFGWPVQFFGVFRNMMGVTQPAVPIPFNFEFNIFNFFISSALFVLSAFNCVLILRNIKISRSKRIIFAGGVILILLVFLLSFSIFNQMQFDAMKISN